ncbi:PAS domain S-box protein [Thiomicrospira microaerophila]|uniref:methyl-accepting chemotaxis protein n=1 Tax=Thiomicrospira microaerophila TaxID=406020 RepID=UPI00200E0B55|nr:PAS domain-containing methyl-accepting chemotaxis protein [Thiomicrospira microaerophila]UQB42329.1 PAS domain S-box protein [Thiomicrospira microaerophila]
MTPHSNEYELPDDLVILSTADLQGNIIDYNKGFREASGYTDEELKGKPHNILRHPDMPKEAFKDFWQTIQSGRPWYGMVKNKRKNGQYYWVAANASPIIEKGKITGYLSVRYPATQEQKQSAEKLYKAVKDGSTPFPWTRTESKAFNFIKTFLPISATLLGATLLWVQTGLNPISIFAGFLTFISASYLLYSSIKANAISDELSRGIENLANGYFKERIQKNDDWGFALNMVRSRVAEQAARNYDALKASHVLNAALNSASTGIMVTDVQFDIQNINQSLKTMLQRNQTKLTQLVPEFNPDQLIDHSLLDITPFFSKYHSEWRSLSAPWTEEADLGNLVLKLTLVPIVHDAKHLGYVIEWLDRTAEAKVTQQIAEVIEGMTEGRFDRRVEYHAEGALNNIKQDVNAAVEVTQQAIEAYATTIHALAQGDLTQLCEQSFQGELDELKQAINQSISKMQTVVSAAIDAAELVSSAASEVADGANQLSESVQQQAAALEQTSATMSEMNAAVQQNTENTQNTAQLATQVQQELNQSSQVMQQTIRAMNEIQASSSQIAEIVTLIDSIAFQTNLLALNAAVEAARAGEHGRGFAVVASEVRALAQKSADAAKDINHLISTSVERINEGTQLASKSNDALTQINQSIDDVSKMIYQIAQASKEQAEGIHQVHQAIADIDGVTQQNAALVEQTSAAAESMLSQANTLKNDMAFFKTETQTKRLN